MYYTMLTIPLLKWFIQHKLPVYVTNIDIPTHTHTHYKFRKFTSNMSPIISFSHHIKTIPYFISSSGNLIFLNLSRLTVFKSLWDYNVFETSQLTFMYMHYLSFVY